MGDVSLKPCQYMPVGLDLNFPNRYNFEVLQFIFPERYQTDTGGEGVVMALVNRLIRGAEFVLLALTTLYMASLSGCGLSGKMKNENAQEPLVTCSPETLTAGEEATWTMTLKAPPGGIEEGGQIIIVYNELFRSDSTGIEHEAHLESAKGARLEEIPFKIPEINEKLTRHTEGYPQIRIHRFSVFLQYVIKGAPLLEGDRFILTLRGRPFPFPEERWPVPVHIDREGNNKFQRLPPALTPFVTVVPGEPAAIRIASPTIVQAGIPFDVEGIVLDRFNNPPIHPYEGEVELESSDAEARIPGGKISLRKMDDGRFRFSGVVMKTPGIQLLTVSGEGLRPSTIPIDCREESPAYHLYWGMLHVHTTLSDGHHPPGQTYTYGRDTGLLDFCAFSDHNQRLNEKKWQETKDLADRFYKPGRFVTFPGYEWSTKPGKINRGYRQIYFPDTKDAPLFMGSTNDVDASIHDMRALVVAQLRSGADWDAPQPEQQRLVEVHTGFATTENTKTLLQSTYWRYSGSPWRKKEISSYGTYQSGLAKGYRIGAIADGDDHSSTPGRCWYDGGEANEPNKLGLAAVYARDLTRKEVFNSLYDRYCYGTTGERIFIDFHMDGHHIGREYETASAPEITYRVGAPYPVEDIEILRDNVPIFTIPGEGNVVEGTKVDSTLSTGSHFYYLRLRLRSGDRAWTSPIWVTKKERINPIAQ